MPTSTQLYDEADALKSAGKLDEAAAKLNELLTTEPDYALAHSALSVIYTRQGRHDDAVRHALRTCELEPNDAFSFTALSVTYQKAGRSWKLRMRWRAPERSKGTTTTKRHH